MRNYQYFNIFLGNRLIVRYSLLAILLISSILLIITLSVYKSFNIYIIFAVLISSTSFLYATFNMSKKTLFINAFILFGVLRLIFFISTNFNIIPFIDNYWELGVIKTFLSEDQIFSISTLRTTYLEGYSAWPMLHTFEVIFITITNLEPHEAHLLLVILIPYVPFTITLLIISLLHKRFNLPSQFIYFATIFIATSPDIMYWSLQLIRTTFAWSLFSIVLLLLLQNYNRFSKNTIIMTIILGIVIVMSHHWSSIMVFLTMIFISFLYIVKRYIYWGNTTILTNNYYLVFTFVICITLLFWLTTTGVKIFDISLPSRNINIERWNPVYPPELTQPSILIDLLRLKTIMLFIPAAFGMYFLYKFCAKNSYNRHDATLIFYVALSTFLLFILNAILNLEPSRITILFAPIFFTALSLSYLILYRIIRYFSYSTMIFVIFIAFLGIYSHSIMPKHLYDNTISFEEVGEHSPMAYIIGQFVNNKLNYNNINIIFSDDKDIITRFVSVSELYKLELIDNKTINDAFFKYNGNRIVIITKDYFPYRYYAGGLQDFSYYDALDIKNILKENGKKLNLLYYDGYNRLHQ
ncbi:MAG: hypothetical protein KatS3mg003_0663 [Candidatus Nitrosocaldaceae archaeon]|nr:MAG: hypothetical protein KatS3mg003_0663 [Candidatus Nitrosocaldaceae archaeon]